MPFRITSYLCFDNTADNDDSQENLILEKPYGGIKPHETGKLKHLIFSTLESLRLGRACCKTRNETSSSYFCTFSCSEIFYSRNNWARHEIAAHHQREIWRCDEESNSICNKGFYIIQNYRLHLKNLHKISNIDEYDIDAQHIPTGFQRKFWCGFCGQCYARETGVDGWKARERHVGDHFEGQNNCSQWISPICFEAD